MELVERRVESSPYGPGVLELSNIAHGKVPFRDEKGQRTFLALEMLKPENLPAEVRPLFAELKGLAVTNDVNQRPVDKKKRGRLPILRAKGR